MIPWPGRRSAIGDVIISLLDDKSRVAEDVFGWSRSTAELGMNEFRTKILCVNDLSNRRKPKAENKEAKLLVDIVEIMEPHSQSESRLRTTLLYTNMTAKAVYNALMLTRHGRSRGLEPVKTLDHDMRMNEKLIPGGILEPVSDRAFLFFTDSYKTSDFMDDGFFL
jgi:hypothetical protein